ncbi:hypothetical protein CP02DC14_1427 [Chlamydia psittaci 02DC14]|nr:hypothetical protein CP02DC14_1427 [Chlamydia psittaci 02DC14]
MLDALVSSIGLDIKSCLDCKDCFCLQCRVFNFPNNIGFS